jgi:hypothetical protein
MPPIGGWWVDAGGREAGPTVLYHRVCDLQNPASTFDSLEVVGTYVFGFTLLVGMKPYIS